MKKPDGRAAGGVLRGINAGAAYSGGRSVRDSVAVLAMSSGFSAFERCYYRTAAMTQTDTEQAASPQVSAVARDALAGLAGKGRR